MFVESRNDENAPPREHPWTVSVGDAEGRYWNFRQNPEFIPEGLEDFQPYAQFPAIQSFYQLLRWLNGMESPFETNDSGLRPPHIDYDTPDLIRSAFAAEPLVIHGRLTILFRDLSFNASRPYADWLKQCIVKGLSENVPNFPAVVFVGEWPRFFLDINKPGHVITLRYWAWGDEEAHAMTNLGCVYDALLQLFQALARLMKQQQSGGVEVVVSG